MRNPKMIYTPNQEAEILELYQNMMKQKELPERPQIPQAPEVPHEQMPLKPESPQGRVPQTSQELQHPRGPDLKTFSMTDLYDMTFPPRTPLIEGLLPCGTYLFVGSPKVGKSFFMAQIGYHVATGIPLWDYPVHKGDVLYLALEDDYSRLQNRMNQMFGIDSVDELHFATRSRTLADGLTDQMAEFLRKHPTTRLIIIDTLQMVRETGNESYSYAMDYQNISMLKSFSDLYGITVVIVHHTRK